MRRKNIASISVAIILAGLAVFGAQSWLESERSSILASITRDQSVDPEQSNSIVVAAKTLHFGNALTLDNLTTIGWAGYMLPKGAFRTPQDLVDNNEDAARFVLSTIETGEPILASKITTPGQRAKLSATLSSGMKAVSIGVNDILGVAGFVFPGDRVDVMLTRSDRRVNEGDSYVDVLLQNVTVVAVDQSSDDRENSPSVVRTVTLEVTTEEAQKLTLASNIGSLSLALRNISNTPEETPGRISVNHLSSEEILLSGVMLRQDEPTQPEEVITVTSPEPLIIGVIRGGKREEYRLSTE